MSMDWVWVSGDGKAGGNLVDILKGYDKWIW